MIGHHRLAPVLMAVVFIFTFTACNDYAVSDTLHLYDLHDQRLISGPDALAAVEKAGLVLVGEHHTTASHHSAQLHVIRCLDEKGLAVSIGMEMFRRDQQAMLDQWIAGEIDEKDFESIYLDNWNFPWALYRDIFIYARERKIPMIGLNVPKGITRQVARDGFASLSADQRGQLEGVTCNVTREYRDFIRRAFGAHGHGKMDFIRFCEAQLVWDTAMAIQAANHLEQHPDRIMVLLAGSGHARKMGIPFQFTSRAPTIPVTVLMPHTPGIFDADTLTTDDADFLIMP